MAVALIAAAAKRQEDPSADPGVVVREAEQVPLDESLPLGQLEVAGQELALSSIGGRR